MRIILDVMGGDLPASELIRGAVAARAESDTAITLAGSEEQIRAALREQNVPENFFSILPADDFVSMHDDPTSVLRAHKESSMARALRALAAGEGDAVVSAGNTGALFTAATLTVRRIRGVRRAALAVIMPFTCPVLVLDCGANVTVTADYLAQFAVSGSIYMKKMFGLAHPRVGLLNNGAEPHKGTPVQVEAYRLLSGMESIRFVGNVEGKDIPYDACDVVVCDGFAGNVLLKSAEGLSRYLMERFFALLHTGASDAMPNGKATELRTMFDAKEYGGAPFLGLAKPVIKAHGNSDARAIQNAIRQAVRYAESGLIAEIEADVTPLAAPAEV